MAQSSHFKRYRVLIVDDSEVACDMLSALFSMATDFDIVGIARNGQEGVEMARRLAPDLITMDLHMPVMNGYDAVEQIMADTPASILVITSFREAETAFRCINLGALDLMDKPDLDCLNDAQFIRNFLDQGRLLASTKVIRRPMVRRKPVIIPKSLFTRPMAGTADHLVAIASSTGGPQALNLLLSAIPADFPAAILIVQHLAAGFEGGLVTWLNKSTSLQVELATENAPLQAGRVLIAPPGTHVGVNDDRSVKFIKAAPVAGHRPSAKFLFEGAAGVYGPECTGVILTGMGGDGAEALGHIKMAGGLTIAQDQGSCIIYGMPKVAVDLGTAKEIVALNEIPARLIDWVGN